MTEFVWNVTLQLIQCLEEHREKAISHWIKELNASTSYKTRDYELYLERLPYEYKTYLQNLKETIKIAKEADLHHEQLYVSFIKKIETDTVKGQGSLYPFVWYFIDINKDDLAEQVTGLDDLLYPKKFLIY